MCSCCAAKALYLAIASGIGKVGVARSLAQAFGHVGGEDTAAGEGEGVMDQDGIPALGNLVGPGDAAVVALVMLGQHRHGFVVDPRDLLPAEELVPAVIVEREDAGQFPIALAGLRKTASVRGPPGSCQDSRSI